MHEYKKSCEIITGNGYTSLGLGDILIPGVCINFSLIFDLSSSNRYGVYFFVNVLCKLGVFILGRFEVFRFQVDMEFFIYSIFSWITSGFCKLCFYGPKSTGSVLHLPDLAFFQCCIVTGQKGV